MKAKTKLHNRQQLLMNAFDFRAKDLKANQSGKLTLHQRQKHRNSNIFHGCAWISIGLLLLLPAVPFFVLSLITMDVRNLTFSASLFAIAIAFIGLSIAGIGLINLVFSNRDIQSLEVKKIQGLAVVNTPAKAESSLSINNIKFKLPGKKIATIKPLEPHIVYYLPKSKIIVSVEAMES